MTAIECSKWWVKDTILILDANGSVHYIQYTIVYTRKDCMFPHLRYAVARIHTQWLVSPRCGILMVSLYFLSSKVTTFLVVVLKSDNHRHHSHPLRLPSNCKFSHKKYTFIRVSPPHGVARSGPHPTSVATDISHH